MRRHPALIPLSRFHRSVLFLALMAKKDSPDLKGYPSSTEGKRTYALQFYREKLQDHFRLEEESLIPAIRAHDPQLDQLADEILDEHQTLHKLFAELEHTPDTVQCLDELGHRLEAHIRKEERQFFQTIQNVLNEAQLNKIGEMI